MEEEKENKGPIKLDWEQLLPGGDDEPPPLLVVTASATERKKSPQLSMGSDQQEQSLREELARKTDSELEEAIKRHRHDVETLGPRLPDGGSKYRVSLKRYEEERERRKLRRVEKDNDGCEKLMQSKSPSFTSASDGLRQEDPSSLPASQSVFTTCFGKTLEEDTYSRTAPACEREVSYLGRCDRRNVKSNGQFSTRERPKSALSSRQSSFQCPTNLSVDVDKHIPSNSDQNDGHCSTPSPCHFEERLSGSFSKKRKAPLLRPSNGFRPRNGKTVVLVDEEEPELVESTEQADKVDEWIKESKIYYPSSDDPESIEICYSDMERLAPAIYLSSTIMNFYIRYLQQPTSPADRARHDYHFFNTYFYEKLKEAVLNKNDNKSLFEKFRRWWKGVNIFHKAYILLPIHEEFATELWGLILSIFGISWVMPGSFYVGRKGALEKGIGNLGDNALVFDVVLVVSEKQEVL